MEQFDIFASYSRADDTNNSGWITKIIALLRAELHTQLGYPMAIFQDVHAIESGARFTSQLGAALASAPVFLVFSSPGYLESQYCRSELMTAILKELHERAAGTIVPIRFVDVDAARATDNDSLRRFLDTRQFTVNFAPHRHSSPQAPVALDVGKQIECLATTIIKIRRGEQRLPLDANDVVYLMQEAARISALAELIEVLPDELRVMVTGIFEQAARPGTHDVESRAGHESAPTPGSSVPPLKPDRVIGPRPASQGSAAIDGALTVAAVGATVAGVVIGFKKVLGTAPPLDPTPGVESGALLPVVALLARSRLLRSYNRPVPRQSFAIGPLPFLYFGAGTYKGPASSFPGVVAAEMAVMRQMASKLAPGRAVWVFADETSDRALAFNSHVWIVVIDGDAPDGAMPAVAFRTTLRDVNIRDELGKAFASYVAGRSIITDHCRRHLNEP